MAQVARLEWEKFGSQSLEAVAEEYFKHYNEKHTLLHLDHLPVIDEDDLRVDYMPILKRAVKAGYQSVMIDASRLSLEENIAATKEAADFAHQNGIPCEAELGAVTGHGAKDADIPYEELFRTKKGFTKLEDAEQFAKQSHCDWLSVAVGKRTRRCCGECAQAKETGSEAGHCPIYGHCVILPAICPWCCTVVRASSRSIFCRR